MATKSILTTYGNNRILDAIAQGTSVPVTAIVYGDANGSQYEPSLDQESLVHQLGALTTISKEFDEDEGFLYFRTTIPANAEAFTLREFGLLDDQNKLLTVTVVPDIEKPAAEEGVSIALPLSIGFKTSTGEIMVIVEDGTDVYANTDLSNLTVIGEHHFDANYANINLTNLSLEGEQHFIGKTRITNCLKDIPQRIAYSLDSGVLTIKAGSIIVVPYGTQDLSSTYIVGSTFLNGNFKVDSTQFSSGKFFVWAILQSDLTVTWTYGEFELSIFVDIENNNLLIYNKETDRSGASAISSTCTFYNTTSNKISRYSAGTETVTNLSFPIARVNSSETQIASVSQIFNGINDMGNAIIIDKGVSCYIPDGRNSNGSLNNIIYTFNNLVVYPNNTIDSDKDYTYFYDYTNDTVLCWLSSSYYLESPDDSLTENRVYYDYDTNSYVQYISSNKYANKYCELGTFYGNTTYMSNFKSKYAFRAIDYTNFLEIKYDLSNLQRDINNAQSTANTALSKATTAKSTADTAKAKADNSVQLTGNQTISGQKTFQNLVSVPASLSEGSAIQLTRRASGVLQLGDGTLFMWGSDSTSNHRRTVTLSYAYNSGNSFKAIICDSGDTTAISTMKVLSQTAKTFTVYSANSSDGDVFQWITIGRV